MAQREPSARQFLDNRAGPAAVFQHAALVVHIKALRAVAAVGQPEKLRLAHDLPLVHGLHVGDVKAVAYHGAPVGGNQAIGVRPQVVVFVYHVERGDGGGLRRGRIEPHQPEAFDNVPCAGGEAAALLHGLGYGGGGGILALRDNVAAMQPAGDGFLHDAAAFEVRAHVWAEGIGGFQAA